MKCIMCFKELDSGSINCMCADCYQKSQKTEEPVTGWICPVCGRGNSPYSLYCDCPPEFRIKTWTSGSGTDACIIPN